jgi:chaperonin GroES
MKFKPLNDRVLVKTIEGPKESPGGIIIPPSAEGKPQKAEVIAVGPGKADENGKRIAMQVEAGDQIAFGKYSGVEVEINNEKLIVMPESDILGVVEPDK